MDGSGLIGGLFASLAMIGAGYQLFAAWALRRFFRHPCHLRPSRHLPSDTAVTLLKPLYGAEPGLEDNLASFLVQDHRGPVQMVCGVSAPDDPAIATVQALRARFPGASIDLVIDPARHGDNGKISNVINMVAHARHPVLVLSDSDITVPPHYLAAVLGELARPGIGAVTCFYTGAAAAGYWSRQSAAMISHVALPDMVVGTVTGLEQPCMGSTIALTRTTLERIGGFAPFADVLADDYALGAAVRALGLKVAIPPMLVGHQCSESSFRALWKQKLRWAATIRGINFWGYLGSVVTRPIPLALLSVPFLHQPGLWVLGAALFSRICVAFMVNAVAESPGWLPSWSPLVDCLEFIVYVASFGTRSVDWRGDSLKIENQGRITARERH